MEEITLQALLVAGCHFGHKAERWHPKASEFIYTEKDGIHIIDLVKTKQGLEEAGVFIKDLLAKGGEVLFVGTKRQARGVLKEIATRVNAPYLSARWIGGFLTNWEEIKKNIEKTNKLTTERDSGAWKKFPKHEQSKLTRYLNKLNTFYGGVLGITKVPDALFIIDIRKEDSAVREAKRVGIPIVAVVDTNSDPSAIDYVIAANDDAVGSIEYITKVISLAYKEGKDQREKELGQEDSAKPVAKAVVEEEKVTVGKPVGKRGRPRKTKPTNLANNLPV